MKRSGIRPKRATPRQRIAPKETWDWWKDTAMPALTARSNGRCERCGVDLTSGRYKVSRHHRVRRRDGGDRLSNLMLLCGDGVTGCHGHVTHNPTEAYANGWCVRALSIEDPENVPVRIDGRLWLLCDDGTKRLVP